MDWLPCPWGCRPVGGWLPNEVAMRLLLESMQIGGIGYPIDPGLFEALQDPAAVAAWVAEMKQHGGSDRARFRAYGATLPAAITRRARDA